jgi:phosphorylcholine metabolism protein LicD
LFLSLERILGFHLKTAKTAEKLEKLLSAWHIEDSKFWCNHGNWQGRLEYAPREQYGDGVMMKFEGLEVRVPELYDQYLTQKYGDWRADLPPEEQVGHHYYEILDLERPYTDYIKSVSRDGRKIKLKKH